MSEEAKTLYIPDNEFVVLYGVDRDAYEKLMDALGEFHLRHTYDQGTLEMRRFLPGVPTESYRQFLEALPEHNVRHTYDGWTLEMMSPRRDHEWVVAMLERMVENMTDALDIPIYNSRSTTLTAADVAHGLQPDASFYVANEPRVRGKLTYEPGKDPPPDLVIEVDVTNSVVPRLPTYAKLAVPEIWRHDGRAMRFYELSSGEYREVDRSVSFPFVRPEDVTRFVDQRGQTDDHHLARAFVAWAREAHKSWKS